MKQECIFLNDPVGTGVKREGAAQIQGPSGMDLPEKIKKDNRRGLPGLSHQDFCGHSNGMTSKYGGVASVGLTLA